MVTSEKLTAVELADTRPADVKLADAKLAEAEPVDAKLADVKPAEAERVDAKLADTKLTDVKDVIAFLAQRFPKCFSAEGETKPLKIGIFKDLAEQVTDQEVLSRTRLRQALRRYTSSWRYLKCVAKGGLRIDLNGEQGAALEADHIEYAAKALEQSKARFEKNRKALKDNLKNKKSYKKSQNDTGESDKKKVKLGRGQQRADNNKGLASATAIDKGGRKHKKRDKSSDKRPVVQTVELLPLPEDKRTSGTPVLVKFGNSPVLGVIKEVNKGDVHVELNSGMVIRTRLESLFLA